jgi:NAD(P)-dependent dehydrogenase (short-subunit alcohol dehydrogenase family)
MSLKNQRIVVLGGTSGIGYATAAAAAHEGAAVTVVSSSAGKLEKALKGLPSSATGEVANLSTEKEIEALFDRIGQLDHLVYTAGEALALSDLGDLQLADAKRFFEVRFWGAVAATKHAAPRIRKGGSIVLTSGSAKDRPEKGWTVPASITGAVVTLTRSLAVELAPLRVNAVAPGVVRSPLWDGIPEAQREAMYADVGRKLLLGRVGEPEDIAEAYLFLMRERFITGQVISVDGGTAFV